MILKTHILLGIASTIFISCVTSIIGKANYIEHWYCKKYKNRMYLLRNNKIICLEVVIAFCKRYFKFLQNFSSLSFSSANVSWSKILKTKIPKITLEIIVDVMICQGIAINWNQNFCDFCKKKIHALNLFI